MPARTHPGLQPDNIPGRLRLTFILIASLALGGCLGMPDKIRPVAGFDADRYLGKWYEVARLDHSFERGLTRVTAEYRAREDGGITVINRGYSTDKGDWQEARGKAYFVNERDEGYLKVSFFGPFYGSYVVFDLDRENYHHAFVSGPDLSYLWLLARSPRVSPAVKAEFIETAGAAGFEVDNLIWVEH